MFNKPSPKVIDLFCGCSGFGLGATQAGFDVRLSVDIDATLTSSHARNFPAGKLLLNDLATMDGTNLSKVAGGGSIDGIIGGPPCQGFSSIGRRDPTDARRELIFHYFRLISEIRPKFFIMENVRGLLFEANRPVLQAALNLVADTYTVLGPFILDAANFGAATNRPRVFIVGYDPTEMNELSVDDLSKPSKDTSTVRDALGDLSLAKLIRESDGFDVWKHGSLQPQNWYQSLLRNAEGLFTGHRKTPHRPEIAARFASIEAGKIDPVGRHPKLAWEGKCPTIRAGTGSDRGSYQAVRPLHPEEPRVITVREAARLQGFPDHFHFHPTVWHSFRMIGNSVSPLVAHHLLSQIWSRLAHKEMLTPSTG